MLFNSVSFLWFLPLVVCLYYLIPGQWRWVLLLAASYTFYMFWRPEYIALVIGTTLVDYAMGLQMGKREQRRQRLPFLLISLCLNLGLLITFKYLGFLQATGNELFGTDWTVLHLILPLGISFHTFQSVGYAIDVYRGKVAPERHLGYFAVFVAYFPQMVAGPIERYDGLGHQLKVVQTLRYDNFAAGFRLIVLGFFAKMVVADNLAALVDQFYKAPISFGRRDAVIALVSYSFQIYCDFYGYSLIALGTARLLGVRLADNFKAPYFSSSVAEFWQRWHISLSTWFRDYLFIPLGGSRVHWLRWALNIMIVFTVSGFWHGARWTFVLWGGMWGLAYLAELLLGKLLGGKSKVGATRIGLVKWLRVPIVFGIATAAWVPFRSENMEKVATVWDALVHQHAGITHMTVPPITVLALAVFILLDLLQNDLQPDIWMGRRPGVVRWSLYALLLLGTLAFAAVDEVPFIYFQF
jgi:alginate O-acetyltransferase complex protein AlgI